MRHGNSRVLFLFQHQNLHSDPTYEAWKHWSSFLFPPPNIAPFRSYLWGMETRFFGDVFCHVPRIPILPMRHGNYPCFSNSSATTDSDPTYEAWKLIVIGVCVVGFFLIPILPMRHGNHILDFMPSPGLINSDPTYEAWKPNKIPTGSTRLSTSDSDPTYEAWKLEKLESAIKEINDSDPTYEAWKLARFQSG